MIRYKIKVSNIAQADNVISEISDFSTPIEVTETTLSDNNTVISLEFSVEFSNFNKVVDVLTHSDGVLSAEYFEVNVIPVTETKFSARKSPKERLITFLKEKTEKETPVEKQPVEAVKPVDEVEEVAPKKVEKPTAKPELKSTAENPESWTEAEIDKMRKLFSEGHTVQQVADLLGRTKYAVKSKKQRLKIPSVKVKSPATTKPKTSAKKVEKPKNNAVSSAPYTFTPEVSHTYTPSGENPNAWTDEEIDILLNNIEEDGKKLAQLINRPLRQIERKRDRLLDGRDR